MKAYLITILIMTCAGIFAPHVEKPTDGAIVLTFLIRVALIAWTVYLLVHL